MYYGQIYGNMPNGEVKRRTEELIDMIGLRGRENDVTKEFSGGMKRKVLVTRALVMDPDLIFLQQFPAVLMQHLMLSSLASHNIAYGDYVPPVFLRILGLS